MPANLVIAQAPPGGEFNWASFTGPLAGAVVGGLVAVIVLIATQRNERRKAHDGRVWAERMRAYAPVATWAFSWEDYYRDHYAAQAIKTIPDLALRDVDLSEPPRPDKVVLDSEPNTLLLIYGSRMVRQIYQQACVTNIQMAGRFADNDGDIDDANDGLFVMAELTTAIRLEAGEGLKLKPPKDAKMKLRTRINLRMKRIRRRRGRK